MRRLPYLEHILIILIVLTTDISSDVLLCSDQSICFNGGTCYLSSVLPSVKQCDELEVFYNDSCLSFQQNVTDWDTARGICEQEDSLLPSIHSSNDLKFYGDYIQGAMIGIEREPSAKGIWINVRSISRNGVPEWAEFPQLYKVDQFFWANQEPNIYANYSNVCVVLPLDSPSRLWVTVECSRSNYAICRRPLILPTNAFSSQCACTDGFSGQKCEIAPDETNNQITDTPQSSTTVICASETFEFACPNGGQIVVDFASFGATEGSKCDKTFQPHSCTNKHSLKTMINRCQGLTYCNITDINSLFPETPCFVKEELSLQYRLRCSKDTQADCPKGSSYIQGRCYSMTFETKKTKQKTFEQAQKECFSVEGTLLSSIDETANEELSRQMMKKVKKGEEMNMWISARTDNEGVGRWTTGDSIGYVPPNSSIGSPSSCISYHITSTVSYWTAIPCESRANYICSFAPITLQRERITEKYTPEVKERVTVEPPQKSQTASAFPDIWCPEREWRSIVFPRTKACIEVKLPCPDPERIIGTVYWQCDCKSGKWVGERPNSNNCTHKWVSNVRESVERGENADNITAVLDVHLKDTLSRQLYGGDISGTVQLGNGLVELAKGQFNGIYDKTERKTRSNDFTKHLGSTGDQLFSKTAKIVWNELDPADKVRYAAELMSVLQQSGMLWADYLEEAQNRLQYSQWAVDVQVSKPSSHAFAPSNGIVMDDQSIMGTRQLGQSIDITDNESNQQQQNVSFSGFANSPLIGMPSLNSLKHSVGSSISQIPMNHPGIMTAAAAVPSLDRNSLKLAYYIFTSLGDLMISSDRLIINSQVIGAAINDAQRSVSLSENVTFIFPHLVTTGVKNPRCVYWDLQTSEWSEEGCSMLSTSNKETVCTCSHLTSFAILMDVSGNVGRLSGGMTRALDIVSSIGCAFSIVCLSLSLFVFTFFRSLSNTRNTIHRNLCFCLLIGELLFVIGVDRTSNVTGCSIVALLLHYFFLSAFCWMLLEGYQLYLMLIQVFEPNNKRAALYCLFAYGIPTVIVAISAGIKWKDYGTEAYCWIDTSTPTIWAFIAPVAVVVLANIIFLLIALKAVLSVNGRDRSKGERIKGWLKGSATLLCLLGVTWIFGFLTAVKGSSMFFAWVFTILNCTQGIFIFVLHVVMNDKVRTVIVRWLRSGICCLPDSSSVYNSKSFVSSRQRFLNMMKGSHSSPSTASTSDSKEIKEMQQTQSATNASTWLRRISTDSIDPISEKGIEYRTSIVNKGPILEEQIDDGISYESSTDPRSSEVLEIENDLTEKKHPVQRKKFPLGVSEVERGSRHGNMVIVERF